MQTLYSAAAGIGNGTPIGLGENESRSGGAFFRPPGEGPSGTNADVYSTDSKKNSESGVTELLPAPGLVGRRKRGTFTNRYIYWNILPF